MNLINIKNLITSGEIVVNTNGHLVPHLNHLFDMIVDTIDFNDEYQTEHPEQRNVNTIEIKPGMIPFVHTNINCYACGKRLELSLTETGHFELTHTIYLGSIFTGNRSKVVEHECILHGQCPAIEYHINVNSPLYFVNHFGESIDDEPDEECKYTDAYSLNYHIGQLNISKYLAHKNIGFGQTGNASGYIYFNKETNIIHILRHHPADVIEDYKYYLDNAIEARPEETARYTNALAVINELGRYQGDIDMSCWRWMCADEKTCIANNLVLNGIHQVKDVNKHENTVKIKVPHGTWKVNHYGRNDSDNGFVWAKIQLEK